MTPYPLFHFLRHGETDWNAQHRYQGQADIPLNDFGRWQAECAARYLKKHPFSAIVASPLARARETAEIINQERHLPLRFLPELMEMHLGEDEGAIKGPWLDEWRKGLYHPKGAETYTDFVKRCQTGIEKALTETGPVLIVAHGGVFWAVEEKMNLKLGRNLNNGEAITIIPSTKESRGRFTSPLTANLPSWEPQSRHSTSRLPVA